MLRRTALLAALFFTLVVIFGSSPAAAADEDGGLRVATTFGLPELAARAKRSVVLLNRADSTGKKAGSGTGFVISSTGLIVTNFHVVDGSAAMTATFAEDERTIKIIGLVAVDEEKDIAIIQAEGSAFVPLVLGESETLRTGDDIIVVGSPEGLSAALSTGVVAAKRENGLADDGNSGELRVTSWTLQITATVAPGSSGSPIMNMRGEVVGVVVGKTRGEALHFGVKIEVAKGLLAGIRPGAAPLPFVKPGMVLRNLGISAGIVAFLALAYVVWKRRDDRKTRFRNAS